MVNGFLELHIWNIKYLGGHSFLYRWLSCALAGGLVGISSRFLQSNPILEVEGEISSSRKGSVGSPSLRLPSKIQSWLLTKLEIKNSQQLSCYSFCPYQQSLELLLFSLFGESLLATTCRIILYPCLTHYGYSNKVLWTTARADSGLSLLVLCNTPENCVCLGWCLDPMWNRDP